jgi:hypothetical protein
MSRPVTETADAESDAHHAPGIWNEPTNLPDSRAVSINVKPVAPKPVSVVIAAS